MRRLLSLACLLGLAACGSVTAPSPVDSRVVLTPGQTVMVGSTGLSLRFEGVQGDSRCPGDAICIAGGDAIVRLTADGDVGRFTHELHTGSLAPVRHAEFTIELVELTPYPFASLPPIQPAEYRATLRVTR